MTSSDDSDRALRAAVPALRGRSADYIEGWCHALLMGPPVLPAGAPLLSSWELDWRAARRTATGLAGGIVASERGVS